MKDLIVEGAKRLIPPSADADAKHVQQWRWFLALLTGATAVSLAAHIALACGLIPAVSPGFALASDVQAIRDERKVERVTDLEAKLLEVKMKQCLSEGVVKQLHTTTLQKMLIEYQRLTKESYPMPQCEDFS